jgi:hypothetical protein
MEVREFEISRKTIYDDFLKQYTFLKQQYSSTLSAAIQETDPAQREALIQQVQQINSQMTDEIRTILSNMNKGGFDSKKIDELTNDLIEYQKDYAEIQQTKNQVNTLKMVKENARKKLGEMQYSFYIYLGILIIMCFYIAFAVVLKPWTSSSWFSRITTGQG